MKKIIISGLVAIYIVIMVLVTICLLKYNDYNVTEFKNTTLIIPGKTEIKKYSKNDLLFVKKVKISQIKAGDDVFYYNILGKDLKIEIGEVTAIDESEKAQSLVIDGSKNQSEYVFGKTSEVKKIPFLGAILQLLTSKIGYLIAIILPIFFIFIYNGFSIVKEIRKK